MIAGSVKDYSTNFSLNFGITFSFKSSEQVIDRCLFPTKLLNSSEKRFTVNDFSYAITAKFVIEMECE